MLRDNYRTIAVEDCEWKTLARRRPAEKDVDYERSKEPMRIASVGRLRTCLKEAGAVIIDSENTTKECHLCRFLNYFDFGAAIVHTCSGCNAMWDQDENAARNLLARAKVMQMMPEVITNTEVTRKRGGRWAKRKS